MEKNLVTIYKGDRPENRKEEGKEGRKSEGGKDEGRGRGRRGDNPRLEVTIVTPNWPQDVSKLNGRKSRLSRVGFEKWKLTLIYLLLFRHYP